MSHICPISLMSSGVTVSYGHLKISNYRVFTLYVTLSFIQCIFYTVLTNSEVLVLIGHLTIQVFWDVMMCGRFRSAAMQHRITGCCLNKTTVEISDVVLTICHWGSSSNILNDCVAFIFRFSCLTALP